MLSRAVRRFWLIGVIVLVVAGGLVLLTAKAMQPSYSANAVVSTPPKPNSNVSAALVSLLATKYVAYAASPDLESQVAKDADVPVETLQSGLAVSMPERTTNISITMVSDDPELSADVVNQVSRRLVARADEDRFLSVGVVVPASTGKPVAADARNRVLVGGALGSLLLALGVVTLLEWRSGSPARTPRDSAAAKEAVVQQ